MPDLIAQGPQRRDRWRRRLEAAGQTVTLGRDGGIGSIPWDASVSRRHAVLCWDGVRLRIDRQPGTTNPIFFHGKPSDQFLLEVGEYFVIGDTRFSLVDDQAHVSMVVPPPVSQQTFTADALRQANFHHAHQQVQALTRLPDIFAGADSNTELYVRLVNLILTGIPSVEAAAVVGASPNDSLDETVMQVLHWDGIGSHGDAFQPSASLIHDAVRTGQSVVHQWRDERSDLAETSDSSGVWAFCCPIPGEACDGHAIYVAGGGPTDAAPIELRDALKFVELVGTTVGHVCDLRRLQKRSVTLAQFFSPPVRDVVAAGDPEVVLAPRMTEVSVLFCDLRGFSRHSEQAADDLLGLLHRVSGALGIMTRQILDFGGVIGDFHGDAAMGFWGWPIPDSDHAVHACQAALAIRAGFMDAGQRDENALTGFRVGMGLATGQAVAGKLGTVDQVKVTAFGPVVNLASRLEGLTRQLGVAILVDAATAGAAQSRLSTELGQLRHVATLQPYGMTAIEDVYELLPARHASTPARAPSAQSLSSALTAFRNGDWRTARLEFERISSDDPIQGFYLRFMQRLDDTPPADWDGVIRFADKVSC